ncbi:MAG: sodium-translocating pyrophosphatase [Promethearchaeota archaeon]|nr:MAG: sodium-translocating pyrophosphatase [Candidatus Lokiarchaeota archaeon]
MSFEIPFLILGLSGGIIAIVFAFFLWLQVKKQSTGTGKINEIYKAIRTGAKAYMNREFKTITIIAVVLAVILFLVFGISEWVFGVTENGWVGLSYIIGTVTSLAASFIGMDLATRTNVRVALAAKNGLKPAMHQAFNGGTIMGMLVFGVNLIQIVVTFSIFRYIMAMELNIVMLNIAGCAFGSSFTSVIAQLGGGIFTKGADVGADIVGKIEAGIPEDDPRNPAVIADAVGDNVGDCAGRSADLYETLTSEIISSMILGLAIFNIPGNTFPDTLIFFPFVIRFVAVLATIGGYYLIRLRKKVETEEGVWKTLNIGLYASSLIIGVVYVILIIVFFQNIFLVFAAIFGIIANLMIGFLIEKYTGYHSKSVQDIAEKSETGAATNIISGMANGLKSVFIPLISIAVLIVASYGCGLAFAQQNAFMAGNLTTGGIYGIVIMAVSMTSATGTILSLDGFGPISDNSGGLVEMSGQPESVRETTDQLDATGNSTKSLTKGFSIISGTVIGFVTIFAYLQLLVDAGFPAVINIGLPNIAIGGILGVALVFIFVSLLMKSVGKTAFDMIEEVRRQFREKPGIMKDEEKPDYGKCVDISTKSALKNMIIPSILIIIMPIIVGLIFGPLTAGAFLIIGTFTGGAMGLYLNIAGASWDNAKKLRKSMRDDSKPETIDAYNAAVIGDTVGDPCKDTAGSSLGSFVTTINNMALTFFPLFIMTYGLFGSWLLIVIGML